MYSDNIEIALQNKCQKQTFESVEPFYLIISSGSFYTWLISMLQITRLILVDGLKYRNWFFKYKYDHSFLLHLLPLMLLSRFFNRKIIIEFDNAAEYFRLDQKQLFFDWLLKQAEKVIVRTESIKRNLMRRSINAEAVPFQVTNLKVTAQVITEVQPKLLYAGPIENITDLESLLKAFVFIKQKYPRAEMKIHGQGSQIEYWRNEIKKQKLYSIEFSSAEDVNLSELFNWADLFVNYYYIEYQSQYLLKAFCSGLPVISSPLGFYEELEDGRNLAIVPFNKASDLARKVFDLVEQPEQVELLSRNSIKLGHKISGSS